jgi:two-component system, OmpR family, sensor histidine kinase CpxA
MMRSLFLKIFLWFWATVVVTGVALILTFILVPRSVPSRWHTSLIDTARFSGTVAVDAAERQGAAATTIYLEHLANETRMTACLFDAAGKMIAGTGCQTFLNMASSVVGTKRPDFNMHKGIARVALMLIGSSGRAYIFVTELPAGPRAAIGFDESTVLMQWGVALLVSGLICLVLTRYLTAPIVRLQEMSQRLTDGDLSARAGPELTKRRDEIGELVRDFNAMATKIEELILQQRQLTSDVSHELRSPLARLNVALDLGRQRKGDDPAFDQMQADIQILDEMIGRLLTLAKLDGAESRVQMDEVDLAELLSQICRDAEFESRGKNGSVWLSSSETCMVRGSAELLHSAIENVVRNAMRYTENDTDVEVTLRCEASPRGETVCITIRDFGPGVPATELKNIFQPFYRVAGARDRRSGGTGLGLAIAERVIRLHGGTIDAENVPPKGLRVKILLPQTRLHRGGS